MGSSSRRHGTLGLGLALLALGVPAGAAAHIERTSYWPDPRPDTSVKPPAGGGVPKVRSLASALDRGAPGGDPPVTPTGRPGPHESPDLRQCVRCNVQIEGCDLSPDDVVIDEGRVDSGNGAPLGSKKDVGIRADGADGLVIRNMTVRHA